MLAILKDIMNLNNPKQSPLRDRFQLQRGLIKLIDAYHELDQQKLNDRESTRLYLQVTSDEQLANNRQALAFALALKQFHYQLEDLNDSDREVAQHIIKLFKSKLSTKSLAAPIKKELLSTVNQILEHKQSPIPDYINHQDRTTWRERQFYFAKKRMQDIDEFQIQAIRAHVIASLPIEFKIIDHNTEDAQADLILLPLKLANNLYNVAPLYNDSNNVEQERQRLLQISAKKHNINIKARLIAKMRQVQAYLNHQNLKAIRLDTAVDQLIRSPYPLPQKHLKHCANLIDTLQAIKANKRVLHVNVRQTLKSLKSRDMLRMYSITTKLMAVINQLHDRYHQQLTNQLKTNYQAMGRLLFGLDWCGYLNVIDEVAQNGTVSPSTLQQMRSDLVEYLPKPSAIYEYYNMNSNTFMNQLPYLLICNHVDTRNQQQNWKNAVKQAERYIAPTYNIELHLLDSIHHIESNQSQVSQQNYHLLRFTNLIRQTQALFTFSINTPSGEELATIHLNTMFKNKLDEMNYLLNNKQFRSHLNKHLTRSQSKDISPVMIIKSYIKALQDYLTQYDFRQLLPVAKNSYNRFDKIQDDTQKIKDYARLAEAEIDDNQPPIRLIEAIRTLSDRIIEQLEFELTDIDKLRDEVMNPKDLDHCTRELKQCFKEIHKLQQFIDKTKTEQITTQDIQLEIALPIGSMRNKMTNISMFISQHLTNYFEQPLFKTLPNYLLTPNIKSQLQALQANLTDYSSQLYDLTSSLQPTDNVIEYGSNSSNQNVRDYYQQIIEQLANNNSHNLPGQESKAIASPQWTHTWSYFDLLKDGDQQLEHKATFSINSSR